MLPAARVDGIGERVRAVAPPAGGALVVLAHPPFGLATAAVFAELRPSDWSGEIEPGRNDLLAPARRLRPELDDLMRLMAAAGAGPQLSGSGPTVFARMDDPERAAGVVERLRRAGVRATLTRLRREAASIERLDESQEEIEG
jgi:4-diphosphocytidyl-2C-methyl-D-erythritol kinase